ncbi:MAG: cyclic nucleotide-binding domain-containing protein [Mariprofundaceae bacterium]|nr:cyclic nucleotide-binding domain-containing protein [Mariprofundaceae bacterium]
MKQQENIPSDREALQEATSAYAGLVDVYPDNENYLRHYAELCLASNKQATALEVLQRLHGILKENTPNKARELAARYPQLGQVCVSLNRQHNDDQLYPSLHKCFGKLWTLLHQRKLNEGETLYQQGEQGDTLSLILEGELAVFFESENGDKTLLNLIQQHDIVGEACFLNPSVRTASIVANRKSTIVELPRTKLLTWLIENPEIQEILEHAAAFRQMLRLISNNALLKNIPMNLRQYIAQKATLLHYPEKSLVYKAGSNFDGISLIVTGEAHYTMKTTKGKSIRLEKVPCGSLIGDTSAVRHATSPANLITLNKLTVAHIPISAFTTIVAAYPPLKESLNQHADEQRIRIMKMISRHLQQTQ